jgi:hypothetical protein
MKFAIPAERVRLKDGVLPHQEIREWEFQTAQEGLVLLKHPKFKYTLGVKGDDIERVSPMVNNPK